MRIACPACAAAYEVPDRLLTGPARTLRCSRCGADFALPQVEAVAEPVIAEPEPSPPVVAAPREPLAVAATAPTRPPPPVMRPESLPPTPPPEVPDAPPAGLVRAWVASIVVVLAAVLSLLVFHAKVMEVWPASTRLFAALGLA
ncbi:zinc-ribbon domain-containing protein [Roseomonas sp. CAU 1739]|uniref:zinc-ribbon domain-containing protein n=1 Tax=Roseomonas sp. CAU 1739 TaxID=3140364 RepID=UPI00325C19DA